MSNITNYFSSHVFTEDFVQQPHQATADVNAWVNEQTHGKISKLFDQDLPSNTALVLLNAVYFKGTWKTKFDPAKTIKKAMFYLDNVYTAPVEMMNVKSKFNYAQMEDGQMIELPFQNETNIAMYIFLPSSSSMDKNIISKTFNTAQTLLTKIEQLREHAVNVHIPKFKFDHNYKLGAVLKKLGIEDALMPGRADFSGINGKQHDLYLSEVIHKTFIEVNEEGSEAAAASGVNIAKMSMPLPSDRAVEFNANRPFIFFIRDKLYGVTLFEGIINKP